MTNKISRTTYFDPAEIRREEDVRAVAIGATVIYAAGDRLFITHAEEVGLPALRDDVHQTCIGKWLERTLVPRIAPMAGIIVQLA